MTLLEDGLEFWRNGAVSEQLREYVLIQQGEFSLSLCVSAVAKIFYEYVETNIQSHKESTSGIADGTPPKDYWRYHHRDCGVKYRGCHPTECPKNEYEKTGIWQQSLVENAE